MSAGEARNYCRKCIQPQFGCYCQNIIRFDPKIRFIILIHPIELRRRIATGRMSHLSLENSELIVGQNYSDNLRINEILADPHFAPVVLSPSLTATNLSSLTEAKRDKLFPPSTIPVIFVIDGTWATAKKTIWQSQNLKALPRICFTPSRPSSFQVRRQPNRECYSTIEAIHETIELLGPTFGFNTSSREHDSLLNVFDLMNLKEVSLREKAKSHAISPTYRRVEAKL